MNSIWVKQNICKLKEMRRTLRHFLTYKYISDEPEEEDVYEAEYSYYSLDSKEYLLFVKQEYIMAEKIHYAKEDEEIFL